MRLATALHRIGAFFYGVSAGVLTISVAAPLAILFGGVDVVWQLLTGDDFPVGSIFVDYLVVGIAVLQRDAIEWALMGDKDPVWRGENVDWVEAEGRGLGN